LKNAQQYRSLEILKPMSKHKLKGLGSWREFYLISVLI
jgi:hypothetical protein